MGRNRQAIRRDLDVCGKLLRQFGDARSGTGMKPTLIANGYRLANGAARWLWQFLTPSTEIDVDVSLLRSPIGQQLGRNMNILAPRLLRLGHRILERVSFPDLR